MLENGDPLTLENGNRLRNESRCALILENGFKIIKEDYGLSTTTTTATTAHLQNLLQETQTLV